MGNSKDVRTEWTTANGIEVRRVMGIYIGAPFEIRVYPFGCKRIACDYIQVHRPWIQDRADPFSNELVYEAPVVTYNLSLARLSRLQNNRFIEAAIVASTIAKQLEMMPDENALRHFELNL
jgi:hypothetical protein